MMTAEKARTIRQVLAGATAFAIAGAVALPNVWGGLCGFAAIGLAAAFFWRDRAQVRREWRYVYAINAQDIALRFFMVAGAALVIAALVA